MDLPKIDLTPENAGVLYREYLKDRHYALPIDHEIRRTYREIAKGGTVIRALEAIKNAGVNAKGLPKLAIVRADASFCFFQGWRDGSGVFAAHQRYLAGRKRRDMAFEFQADTFPRTEGAWAWRPHQAITPLIPLKFRPRQGLEKYHILWEAEWQAVAPIDPVLLRRLGLGDLWLVVAAWDLTEVERAALTARISAA